MWFESNHLFSAVLSSRSPSPGGSLPTFTPSCLWIRLKATRSFSDNWRRTCVRSQVMTASLSSQTGELTEAEVAWNKHDAPHIGADSTAWYQLEDQSQQFSLENVLMFFQGMSTIVNIFPLSIISLALFMWGLLRAHCETHVSCCMLEGTAHTHLCSLSPLIRGFTISALCYVVLLCC